MRICKPGGRQFVAPQTASPILKQLFLSLDRPMVDIASELGMTRVGLAYWKSGRCNPDIMSVESFAQAAGYRLVLEKL